jgi:hypothetical protein
MPVLVGATKTKSRFYDVVYRRPIPVMIAYRWRKTFCKEQDGTTIPDEDKIAVDGFERGELIPAARQPGHDPLPPFRAIAMYSRTPCRRLIAPARCLRRCPAREHVLVTLHLLPKGGQRILNGRIAAEIDQPMF